jgi:hypothetical protein
MLDAFNCYIIQLKSTAMGSKNCWDCMGKVILSRVNFRVAFTNVHMGDKFKKYDEKDRRLLQ